MLPNVSPHLPDTIETNEARRFAAFLRAHDSKLDETVALTLYGSAAVALFLADEEDYTYGYSRDIDVGHMEPSEVDLTVDSDTVEPPLHFQLFELERWLVHPDWESDTVDVTPLLQTAQFTVRLLHPLDLIITKLARGQPQDIEDGILLRRRYFPDETETARRRTREAWKYRPPSDREQRVVEDAFEAIFETALKLG